MKPIIYKDRRGFFRRNLIRDDDGDEMAEYGLPAGPPDVEHDVDWEGIIREINNILVLDGAITRLDLQKAGSLDKISSIVKRHVDAVYRELKKKST